MERKEIIKEIRKDPVVTKEKEIVVVCLNRTCEVFTEDAFLYRTREVTDESLSWEIETPADLDQRDQASILDDEGEVIVTYIETRPAKQTGCPNGVTVDHEELYCPMVLFFNSGAERVIVDGSWVEPGSYMTVEEVQLSQDEMFRLLRTQGYPLDEAPELNN